MKWGGLMRRVFSASLATILVIISTLTFGATEAAAVDQAAGRLVSDDPANNTPHALDGQVYSVVQVGSQMVVGGTFTTARNNNSATVLSRNRLMAFDAASGAISTTFNPSSNGTINVVLPAGDGTVYVGGSFTTIAGKSAKNLARLRVSDGSLVTSFNGGSPSGVVKDLRLAKGKLWVAGAFTHIAGKAQPALATLNPASGAFDTYFSGAIAGVHKAGSYTTVMKIDANQQGNRLAVVGNFDTLNGVKNHQMMLLDISGASAAPAAFQSNFYNAGCSSSFDTYMRDVDFAPSGSFFVVSTTGAYGGYGDNIGCDSAARFDISETGTAILPSWVDYTGGDTSYAVEVTDTAVYIGGHQRWWNNPYAGDRAGQGAVSRPGIAALNPLNGVPFSWNPTRDRGIGVFDLLNTSQGLWAVSDTDRIGNYEYHARIAMFPAAGKQVPAYTTAPFPNNVFAAGPLSGGTQPQIVRRSFDGTTAGTTSPTPDGGIAWGSTRGAFMVNGQVYLGTSDGSLTRRDFDGSTFGSPVNVDGQDQLVVLQNWRSDVAAMTGMFYDSGRIYYTINNNSTLFYRYVNLESDIVGALRKTASGNVSGIDFSKVKGMFLGGDTLYWATADGVLHAIDWQQGARSGSPVAGTAAAVSGPQIDGINWSARTLFLYQDGAGQGAGLPPTAAFTADCTSRSCTFDASGSTAPGGTIASYAWDFGDGTPAGTGVKPTHEYGSDATFQVKLTITTADAQTATVTVPVSVTRVNKPPVSSFEYSCTQLDCTFDGSGSSDPDGTLASLAWDFGDGTTATGATATHTFAPGNHVVTLTVTDNDGAATSSQQSLDASEATVEFVAATSANGNLLTHQVKIPANAQAGDRLLLFLTINSNATVTAPAGWTQVRATDGSGIAVRAWTKIAAASDPGATVAVPVSAYSKGDLTVMAYRSNTAGIAIVDSAESAGSALSSVPTPTLSLQGAATPVFYLGTKANAVVTATLPAQLTARSNSAGTPNGAILAWSSDAGYVSAGSFGPLNVALSGSVSRAVLYGLALQAQ